MFQTFFGYDMIVFQGDLNPEEQTFRYTNECKQHPEDFYLGSKNKCPNCGFVLRLQGKFFWLNQPFDIHIRKRWWPYNPQDEFVQKVLKMVGYELMYVEGMFMLRDVNLVKGLERCHS